MPIHTAAVDDGISIIRQLPTSFDNFGNLVDYALRKITSNNLYSFVTVNVGTYVSSFANVPDKTEVDLSEWSKWYPRKSSQITRKSTSSWIWIKNPSDWVSYAGFEQEQPSFEKKMCCSLHWKPGLLRSNCIMAICC